jgi:hypothetical protein
MRNHFRYHFRNNIYLRLKYYPRIRALLYILKSMADLIPALAIKEHRWLRMKTILFGILSGLFFRPRPHPPGPPASLPLGVKDGAELLSVANQPK